MKSVANNSNPSDFITLIKQKDSAFWSSEEKKKSLLLFHQAAKEVPAYKDFLKRNNVDPEKIKNWENLKSVPFTSKKNYLRHYPLENLSWGGSLNKPLIFTSTSGSTGEPFYFHRSFELNWQSSIVHELFLLQGQYKKDELILVVVCFGMGAWIGGLITYQAFHLLQEKGYNISLITPGINKEEIFKSLKSLGKSYKNIILAGYPPFIKDIVYEAKSQGIKWSKLNVRLLFAAETFTEDFRKYVSSMVNAKNTLLDTMNIYGTADLGTMAFETPLTILIRQLCAKNQKLFEVVFNEIKKTPTLCQYIPSFIAFDSDAEDLSVNGDNTIPLVRYSLGDYGGVYSFNEMVKKFNEAGVNLKEEIKKSGVEKFCYELPFVYVYERKDFSTKLYGATIYPEHIREALLHPGILKYVTGKFTVITKYDKNHNQYMEINCELQKDHKSSIWLKKKIKKAVTKNLIKKNSEYYNNFKSVPKKVEPRIVLCPNEYAVFFKPGVKQKWVGATR